MFQTVARVSWLWPMSRHTATKEVRSRKANMSTCATMKLNGELGGRGDR